MNVYLVPFLKLYTSFSYSKGDLNMDVQGVDGTFSKFPAKLGLLTQLKIGKFFDSIALFHFGPCLSYYINPVLKEKWVNYNSTLNYRNAMGWEVMGGFNFVSIEYPRLFYYIEFHYHQVQYKFHNGQQNSMTLVPGNTKYQWRELDGRGYGTYLGFGVRI